MDTGEQRSPKNAPESTAPPVRITGTPMTLPMVAQMTPMVAAVPKEVPVSTDTPAFKRKVMSRNTPGRMSSAA